MKWLNLKKSSIKADISGEWDSSQEDTLDSEIGALLNAFKKIDKYDIIYIFLKKGYIGKTVAMEISYAYAKNKEIISSEEIEELSARGLVSQILDEKNIISYCKD